LLENKRTTKEYIETLGEGRKVNKDIAEKLIEN
jgi:hypothetical protein